VCLICAILNCGGVLHITDVLCIYTCIQRHHLAQSVSILNTDGCNIFENLSSEVSLVCECY
jgi:hypothetical protein